MNAHVINIEGCDLAYKIIGDGDPVLFIQGAGLHGDGWLPQTEDLSSQFRCITFDNRGMGASLPATAKLSVERMAADSIAVLDAAGVSSAHIVGHSLGGAVAQQIALTHRDRAKSLALLCTSNRGADATGLTWQMLKLGMRSRIGSRPSRRRAFLEMVMPASYLATQDTAALASKLEPIFGHDLADTPSIVMAQLGALKRFDPEGKLVELKGIKTLVVSAEGDIIFPPRSGRALAAAIPGATYVEVPNAAHGVTIQYAEQINAILAGHLRS